jgi:transposase
MYNPTVILKVLDLKKEKMSNRQIAKLLKIGRQTVNRWVTLYSNNLSKLQKNIYSNSVYDEILRKKNKQIDKRSSNFLIINYVIELFKKNPFYTKAQIASLVTNKFNVKCNPYNVSLIIRKLNYTYKKPRKYMATDVNFIDKLKKERELFCEKIKQEISKIISIDESGFNKIYDYKKGCSLKGTSISTQLEPKSKNISLLMAITTDNILHYSVSEQNIDGLIYVDFIKKIIEKLNSSGYIFLMDNVPFHHVKELKKIIKDSNNSIMYTPKYSPNHNPIENLFGIIKNHFFKLDKKEIDINNYNYDHDYDHQQYTEKQKNRKRKINKVKYYILLTIQDINLKYNSFSESIFKRAINFNYTNIENELRDRIIIQKK